MMINYPEEENIKYFQQLQEEYPYAEQAYSHIISTINSFLANGDLNLIKSLTKFIEEEDGRYAFTYIGSVPRILAILNILRGEGEHHMTLLSVNCSTAEQLLEKYRNALFALRRILFHFSEEDVVWALTWLQSNNISSIAVYTATQWERINPDPTYYRYLSCLYPDFGQLQ